MGKLNQNGQNRQNGLYGLDGQSTKNVDCNQPKLLIENPVNHFLPVIILLPKIPSRSKDILCHKAKFPDDIADIFSYQ